MAMSTICLKGYPERWCCDTGVGGGVTFEVIRNSELSWVISAHHAGFVNPCGWPGGAGTGMGGLKDTRRKPTPKEAGSAGFLMQLN